MKTHNNIYPLVVLYLAGGSAFITSLPQLYQILKTQKVRDINPIFFCLHLISDILYMVYGILINDNMITYSFTLPIASNMLIFILYFYYKNKYECDKETQTNNDCFSMEKDIEYMI